MAVNAPRDERRLRANILEFEIATHRAEHGWKYVDLTNAFGEWLGAQEYRDEYFRRPQDLEPALSSFLDDAAARVCEALLDPSSDERCVVCLAGLASLFGICRVSSLLERVQDAIRGRLLVLFPGERDGPNYRLLDARDGWNYLAIPITAAGDQA
jgi:hypothetical protein